jgi:Ala-tRNA(Pro) deacylase
MATATWIKNELEERGLRFEELHHDDAYTAQAVAQKEHVSGHRVAKVVAVMAEGRPVQLILPASRRVALDRVAALLGVKHVRLASEAELQTHFPDCELGALPAWRHWPGVEVLMDQTLRDQGEILFQAGTHRDAVRMGFDDWFRMVQPIVGDFSEPRTMAWPPAERDEP